MDVALEPSACHPAPIQAAALRIRAASCITLAATLRPPRCTTLGRNPTPIQVHHPDKLPPDATEAQREAAAATKFNPNPDPNPNPNQATLRRRSDAAGAGHAHAHAWYAPRTAAARGGPPTCRGRGRRRAVKLPRL